MVFFSGGEGLLGFVFVILVYFIALSLTVLWGTHVAFHTWRRLEQRYPKAPPGPPLPR